MSGEGQVGRRIRKGMKGSERIKAGNRLDGTGDWQGARCV